MSLGRYVPNVENIPKHYFTAANALAMVAISFTYDCGKGTLRSLAVAEGILSLYLADPVKFKKTANTVMNFGFSLWDKKPHNPLLPTEAPTVTKRMS